MTHARKLSSLLVLLNAKFLPDTYRARGMAHRRVLYEQHLASFWGHIKQCLKLATKMRANFLIM
jgi:hypothetical protein